MRNKFYIASLLLVLSCQREKTVTVSIDPIKVDLHGNINQLREQVKKRNITLVYENSYEGEEKGIKFFYFDEEIDSLDYHLEIYTIGDRIEGISASVSSNKISQEQLHTLIDQKVLPVFKNSTNQLQSARVSTDHVKGNDGRVYYTFELETQELENKRN